MKKRIDYKWPRSALFGTLAFVLAGALPRALGIITTKPEFQGWIGYYDLAGWLALSAAFIWAVWAMVHNARLEQEKDRHNEPVKMVPRDGV